MVFCDILELIIIFLKLSSYTHSNCFTLCCVNKTFKKEFYDKYKILCLNDWFDNHISTFYKNNLIHSYKNFKMLSEICFRFNLISKTNLKPIVGIVKIRNGKLSLIVSSGCKTKSDQNMQLFNGYNYRSTRIENIKSLKNLKNILSSNFFDECLYISNSEHTYTMNVIKSNVKNFSIKVLRFGE